jgi:aspartate/glutamate racemase
LRCTPNPRSPEQAGFCRTRPLVDKIIFDELCAGVFTEASKARYLAVISDLETRGAEGVILGCTESRCS